MLNYKKPIKVKSKLIENEQVTIAPADTKTQVIKAGNKTIGTVSNPTVANQLKTAIQKGEVNLAQDLKEEAPPDQEQWIKDNKDKFIKQYGKKGEAILYATAWQRHNKGVKESRELDLDKLFESVAFDEPDPVSHILSKFKFEVNQFCQGQQINPDLYDCLYDYYLDAGLMPYGVAKARDANPIEWVSSKLKEYLGQCGVSQQTSPPVDSPIEAQNEQPVPEYGDDVEQQVSSEPTEQEIDQMFESILGNRMINEGWTDDKKVIMTRLAPVLSKYKLKATVGLFNNNTIQLKITSGDIDFVTNTVNKSTHDKSYCARVLKTKNIQVSKDGFQNAFTGRAVEALTELFKAIKYGDYGSYFTIYIGGIDGSYKLTGPKEKWNTSAQEQLGLTNESKIKESKMKVTQPKRKQVAESSIDRKARHLVDSWNLKLKQKLSEKEAPPGSVFKVKITYKSPSGGYASGIIKVPANNSEIAKKYVQTHVKKPELRVVSATLDKTTNVDKMFGSSGEVMQDLKESTQKRKLREGVSISTSQSQGFGYDEIDGNTSINVCATGEDAVRLAEILRDAGFGQFKQSHIAVPQQAIVSDFHDDVGEVQQPEYDPMPEYDETQPEVETHHDDGDDESQLLDRIKQFVSYGAETPVEEITEAEDMGDSEVVVYNGKLGIVVDADTGADNEYEVMFADSTEMVAESDLKPATQAQIDASTYIVKYVGDDAQFTDRYGIIIEEDGDKYRVAFSDGETWADNTDIEAPALQESFANEYQMSEPAQTNYMTHGISGGLNSLRRSQATGNVTRISTMESKGKGRKMLKESKQAVGKPSDELASMANLVEAISVQQRIKFGA